MDGFMENLKTELDNEKQLTENGALGYKTTGKDLLDLNFSISSLRNSTEQVIIDKFMKAYYEDKMLAMKWLFYCRDREAIGERRTFRVVLKYMAEQHSEIAKEIISLVPEYGRWDDLWCLLETNLKDDVIFIVKHQIYDDAKNMQENKPISLLAKWLPSVNCSSVKSKNLARIIRSELGLTEKQYRKILSSFRKYLNVVEVKMSAKEWSKIDYSAVPSRANLIYNDAFLRNDEERRTEYLAELERGDKDVKINASVLFPHDIVHKYFESDRWYSRTIHAYDITLEELWKALPDYVNGAGNTICVADGSGSMMCGIGGTKVTCLDVANSLAIYFAERSSGQFKDKYITFSEHPQLVDFSNANSLKEKIEIALMHNEIANTNIEAVFDLILNTAVNNNMNQNEIPQNILVLSDCEFDSMCCTNSNKWEAPDKTLFDAIADKYAEHGYKLPRLVFWNICSRTGTIPVKENESGVALVSGFSPAIMNMVLSNELDPYKCLVDQLNTERYQPVEDSLSNALS